MASSRKDDDLPKRSLIVDPTGCPPFLKLPTELRLIIYSYFVPQHNLICLSGSKLEFHIEPMEDWANYNLRSIFTPVVTLFRLYSKKHEQVSAQRVWMSLFLVNKLVFLEARTILYGENLFRFSIDYLMLRKPVQPLFGIFDQRDIDQSNRLHQLRELRRIELDVFNLLGSENFNNPFHRNSLEYFANTLKKYATDADGKPLLKVLKVCSCLNKNHVYFLESLSSLRGVEDVRILGVPKRWFAECLEKYIRGEGGDIQQSKYSTEEIENGIRNGLMTKKHPSKFDWKEFAQRNGIKRKSKASEYNIPFGRFTVPSGGI